PSGITKRLQSRIVGTGHPRRRHQYRRHRWLGYEPSAVSRQPSAVSRQPSARHVTWTYAQVVLDLSAALRVAVAAAGAARALLLAECARPDGPRGEIGH